MKTITVEELAANVTDHIASVKEGETLSITSEGKEIATITPTRIQRGVRYPFRNLNLSPPIKNLDVDVVALIREDRDRDRTGLK